MEREMDDEKRENLKKKKKKTGAKRGIKINQK